jgi:hypothetical protein
MNYHVARNGQQLGVLSSTDISLKLSTGDLSPQDLAWTEGMTNWQPISTISGLAAGGPPSLPDEVNPYAAPRAEISVKRGTPLSGSGWAQPFSTSSSSFPQLFASALPGPWQTRTGTSPRSAAP